MSLIEDVDVVIVGGGPAGLSAALILGRCRRRVVLFDGGHHRNDEARAMHGYLTREGTPPAELLRIGRAELAAYPTVALRTERVTGVARDDHRFLITTGSGARLRARRMVIATGVRDVRPPVDGVAALHGKTVVPCPYCDGWELRDRSLGVYSHGDDRGARYAATVYQWSHAITLYTGGPATLSPEARARLGYLRIPVDERPVVRVSDEEGVRLWFADGASAHHAALFYHLGCEPDQSLARQLGAGLDDNGGLVVDGHCQTTVPGLYAAGDATRDSLQAIVGAGEGAAAAMYINRSLNAEAWDALPGA